MTKKRRSILQLLVATIASVLAMTPIIAEDTDSTSEKVNPWFSDEPSMYSNAPSNESGIMVEHFASSASDPLPANVIRRSHPNPTSSQELDPNKDYIYYDGTPDGGFSIGGYNKPLSAILSKDKFKIEASRIFNSEFNNRLNQQEFQLERLEKKVANLREFLGKRRDHMHDAINKKVEEALKQYDQLGDATEIVMYPFRKPGSKAPAQRSVRNQIP